MVDPVQRSTMMSWAMDELRAQGVPEANAKAAAAHLVGQAEMESGLNPSLSHDSGTGYGIYGARLDRRAHMLDWMTQNGYSPSSPEGQMRYMAREAMSGQYPRTRAVLMGANETGFIPDSRAITAEFERPAIINNRAASPRWGVISPLFSAIEGSRTGRGGRFINSLPCACRYKRAALLIPPSLRGAFSAGIPTRTSHF